VGTAAYRARVSGAHDCDVLIVGAGPAGAAAAQLLASWGRSVLVVHGGARGPSLAESLPPSIRKLLAHLGQLERVDAAGFYPNHGNVADWAGAARATKTSDAGYHVSRREFDAVLGRSARAAGARIVDGRVRRVDGDDPTRVACVSPDGSTSTIAAQYVLDCSGRAGAIARRGLRREPSAYRTLAVVAEWECPEWPAAERAHTTIESYRDGWAWSVPLSDTRRQCTVMITPPAGGAAVGGRPGAAMRGGRSNVLQALYADEIGKPAKLAARLARARQISRPWTCDAALYDSTRAAEGRVLLVGDAASFIEPLSSAGVKKALLSAWRAAVVVNTCLDDTAMAAAARDLFVERERDVFADCIRRSRTFFREAARAYDSPFWSARADFAAAAATDGDADDPVSDEALGRDASVRNAFERLRRDPSVRLRSSAALRFEPAPAIEGRRVVMRDRVVVPRGAPLQYAAGVDLSALVRLAGDGREVPALIDAYRSRVAPAPIAGLLTGLSLLVARQALVEEGPTP